MTGKHRQRERGAKSNSGRQRHSGATCRRTDDKAISTDYIFNFYILSSYFCSCMYVFYY